MDTNAPRSITEPDSAASALDDGLAPKLRLFVWADFNPDYTSGLAFAIAKDETDARKQIEKERGCTVSTWGDLTIYPLTKRIARSVSGGG